MCICMYVTERKREGKGGGEGEGERKGEMGRRYGHNVLRSQDSIVKSVLFF